MDDCSDQTMTKIIWLSDPHFATSGDVQEHDPRVRITAAIDHINAHHSDAQFCVISGDLVNRGSAEDYRELAIHLAQLEMPVLPMMGNHDNREMLRNVLPMPPQSMAEFVQYRVETGDGLLLCLDTHKIGSDGGEFCEARASWLKSQLNEIADTPVYLFMHHPPMALGLPMQDTDCMENGAAFLDLIGAHNDVKYMFIGHVHRPISGTVRGIPFSTMRSVLYQAPAPDPAWDWNSFSPAKEAPAYGVLTLSNGDVNLQYIQFCEAERGGSFN